MRPVLIEKGVSFPDCADNSCDEDLVTNMTVVDAHHHFWDLSGGRYPWLQDGYDPEKFILGNYQALRRNFLPPDYLEAVRDFDVIATVHIEAERHRSESLEETRWLSSLHQDYSVPNAIVAYAPLNQDDTADRLGEQAQIKLVRGIRCKPLTSASPDTSVRGLPGSMQDEKWLRGLEQVEKLGLTWDLRVPYWHLGEAAQVAAMFPGLPIVLNHHGLAADRTKKGVTQWREGIDLLARQPNVHIKLSEFGLLDSPWVREENAPIAHHCLQRFGWERCMFGSDYPVCELRIGFPELLDAMDHILSGLTPQQRHAVMCTNALRFYRIDSWIRPRSANHLSQPPLPCSSTRLDP